MLSTEWWKKSNEEPTPFLYRLFDPTDLSSGGTWVVEQVALEIEHILYAWAPVRAEEVDYDSPF